MNRTISFLAMALLLGFSTVPAAADQPAAPPDWFSRADEGRSSTPDASHEAVVKGRRSYSEERAEGDARIRLQDAVDRWLAPDVPAEWTPPTGLVEGLIAARHVEAIPFDREALGLDPSLTTPEVLYVAGYRLDLGPDLRADFVAAYDRERGERRMTLAGGALAFLLAILAIVAGYIRADEATRGYYTTRLRLLAGAAAGAATVAAYRWLT